MKPFLLLLSVFYSFLAFATDNEKHHYLVPDGDANGYLFSSSCLLSKDQKLKDCKTFKSHQICKAGASKLENVTTKKQKEFQLIAHVFKTKKLCEKDLSVHLHSEQ